MTLPVAHTVGDSLQFDIALDDYPANDGWQLRCVFINAAQKVTLVSSAIGADHRFTADATTTATWVAGKYKAVIVAEKSPLRNTVIEEDFEILPDPIATANYDYRSASQKTLDNLRAAYDAMIAGGGSMVQQVSINGRMTTFRAAEDILQQINFWQRQVQSENTSQQLQSGNGFGTKILTRLA
jgi:hypothetical protein